MKRQIYLILFLSISLSVTCQEIKLPIIDSVINRFTKQLDVFPQEKIYVQTDKSYYMAGEKIWARFFLIDATLHNPTIASRYVYAEIINPVDSVISRVKIRPVDSMYYGYIQIPTQLPGGNYRIRAYTQFMRSLDESYIFKKNIQIAHPLSSLIKIDTRFTNISPQKLSIELKFIDLKTNKPFKPDNLHVELPNEDAKPTISKDDSIIYVSINSQQRIKLKAIYIELNKEKKIFKQYIQIPPLEKDYDVSFLPEGGYMIPDLNCQIAFKAVNSNGLSEEIKGDIYDNENNYITNFQSLHLGMGAFYFIPSKDKSYYAIVKNKDNLSKRFELPSVSNTAYSLKTEWRKQNLAISVLKSDHIKPSSSLYLIIHARGIIKYIDLWNNKNDFIFINCKDFPSGILQVLLIDQNLNILSERLTFCTNKDQAKVNFKSAKDYYNGRDEVKSFIQVTDMLDKPIESTFSLSITDDNDITPDSCNNILSSLLIDSELRGNIESPAYYFKEDNKASRALDILMLTQGWKRYNIPNILKNKYEYPKYPIEIGQYISGNVKSWVRDRPAKDGIVEIFSPNNNSYADITTIDSLGKFYFTEFEMPDSTQYIIRAKSKKGDKYVKLSIDKEIFPMVNLTSFITSNPKEEENLKDFITKAEKRYSIENGMKSVYLSEVKVETSALTRKNEYNSFFMDYTDKILKLNGEDYQDIIFISDISRYLPEIQTKLVFIKNPMTNIERNVRKFVFRNRNSISISSQIPPPYPKIIIDDFPMPDDYNIDDINIFEIASIGYIKPPKSGNLIMDAFSGAILINTKRGNGQSNKIQDLNIKTITPLGYQKPVEFYSPKYESSEQKNNLEPDLRSTIFWKPNGKTSKNGEANISFYTADSSNSTYSVVIEGITHDGKIFHSIDKITIKE